jgi:curved DNA-binding protein
MNYRKYYEVLGLEPGASNAAIEHAYRRLVREYHPDRSRRTDAAERFKEVAAARAALKDLGVGSNSYSRCSHTYRPDAVRPASPGRRRGVLVDIHC